MGIQMANSIRAICKECGKEHPIRYRVAGVCYINLTNIKKRIRERREQTSFDTDVDLTDDILFVQKAEIALQRAGE